MTSPADKTAKIQRGRPFKAGQSGNPAGRPIESRKASTIMMEHCSMGRPRIEKAKEGDSIALDCVWNGLCRQEGTALSVLLYRRSRLRRMRCQIISYVA